MKFNKKGFCRKRCSYKQYMSNEEAAKLRNFVKGIYAGGFLGGDTPLQPPHSAPQSPVGSLSPSLPLKNTKFKYQYSFPAPNSSSGLSIVQE
jgi:hypothetical protein